ncbi:protein HEATR9 [Carettochelys insculpta]|uniref:protein HEATR9 n=1 Tax=Carettochelys insculpta TaxID=44489 RepID=UPI003EBF288A
MGEMKMPLERLQSASSFGPMSWRPMTEPEEKTAGKKELEFRVQKPPCRQTPREVYPLPPSVWRKSALQPGFTQPRIVEQPRLAHPRQQSAHLIKAKRKTLMTEKKMSDFLLSKFQSLYPATNKWKDSDLGIEMLKLQRIKELRESLASSVEQEQIYAAQALGCLRVTDESVLSALRNTLQVCRSLPVRYEVTRTLLLLGCLDVAVVKELIRHLKKGSPAQRKDALAALAMALHTRATFPESQSVGSAQARLTGTLEHLASSWDPTDDSVLSAATCLVYLDASSPTALEVLLKCLTQENMKKKMKVQIPPDHSLCALVMLVKHMMVARADVIQALMDQLRHSPVYKHRAAAANLLSTIRLEPIRREGLEEEVFQLLVEKLHQEPFLVVRKTVAMTAAVLQMKGQIWDLVEKQLKEKSEVSRRQAVVSLGVLGLRSKHMFFTLLEMLELDSSPAVRIQVIRAFCTLGMNNRYVLKTLLLKEKTDGAIASECAKALKILQKLPGARRGQLSPFS